MPEVLEDVFPLTDKQTRILKMIYESIRAKGRQPTIRELGQALGGMSTNGVACHIRAMIKKGYLDAPEPGPSKARAFQLLRRPDGSPFEGFTEVVR